MRTPEYLALVDMLTEHPEFSYLEDNPCDAEIIAYGSYLWEKWGQSEVDDLGITDELPDIDSLTVSPKVRDILQMTADGCTNHEIKSKHGITALQLTQIKSRHGLSTKVAGVHNARNTKYQLDKETVLKDLQRLNSVPKLAKEYKMPKSTLEQYLQRNGITDWYCKKEELFTLEQIVDAKRHAKTQKDTAKYLGISHYTLPKALKRLGVTWKEVKQLAA